MKDDRNIEKLDIVSQAYQYQIVIGVGAKNSFSHEQFGGKSIRWLVQFKIFELSCEKR